MIITFFEIINMFITFIGYYFGYKTKLTNKHKCFSNDLLFLSILPKYGPPTVFLFTSSSRV